MLLGAEERLFSDIYLYQLRLRRCPRVGNTTDTHRIQDFLPDVNLLNGHQTLGCAHESTSSETFDQQDAEVVRIAGGSALPLRGRHGSVGEHGRAEGRPIAARVIDGRQPGGCHAVPPNVRDKLSVTPAPTARTNSTVSMSAAWS